MKKYLRTITKTVVIFTFIGLLTACGANGTVEEYVLTENDAVLTDEEKQEKYILYLQEVLADDIASAYPAVKDVNVTLTKTEESVAVTDAEQTMQAEICLDLEDELAEDSIVEIAEAVATAIASETDKIIIQDADGQILYIRSEALPEKEI